MSRHPEGNNFNERVPGYISRVQDLMTGFVADRKIEGKLGEAVDYAVRAEGKRIRPLLSYATAELLGIAPSVADYPAAAIELVHTYSLVHDDLPAMDDDDLRRGQPTVHKQFDEATGILVGDALLTMGFELLSSAETSPEIGLEIVLQWVRQLAEAAGAEGMIAGQATDLEGESRTLELAELEQMHRRKSGALIETSIAMVAVCGDAETADRLAGFGHHIGLAFQIRDDILDVEGTTEHLGKMKGSDAASNKSTFVSLLGLEEARRLMQAELGAAQQQLAGFGEKSEGLCWLAEYIVARTR